MKTEAIREAAERLRLSGHYELAARVEEEVEALEGCVHALGATLDASGHLRDGEGSGGCSPLCACIRDALERVGVR